MLFSDDVLWWGRLKLTRSHRTPLCLNGMDHAAPSCPGSQTSGCPLRVRDVREGSESESRRLGIAPTGCQSWFAADCRKQGHYHRLNAISGTHKVARG